MRKQLLVFEQAAGGEDEDLADHVGVLLVAGHEPDHAAVGGALDDALKALAHHVLEGHALFDDRAAATAVEHGRQAGGVPAPRRGPPGPAGGARGR